MKFKKHVVGAGLSGWRSTKGMTVFGLGFLLVGACTGTVLESEGSSARRNGLSAFNEEDTRPAEAVGENGRLYKKPGGSCRVAMPMRRLTDLQYRNTVDAVFGGLVASSEKFPKGELGSSITGFSTEPAVTEVTKLGVENVLDSAEEVALGVVGKIAELVDCAAEADAACAENFIDVYGPRAFRRPLTDDERSALKAVFAQGEGRFDLGIALVVSTMLQSPQFLYLVEEGTEDGDPMSRRLKGYEIANRLSYLYWDGPPDQNLIDAANGDELFRAEEVTAQADRMLDDPKAVPMIHRFAREWLELQEMEGADRKPAAFDDDWAFAQRREFDLFIEDAFLSGGTLESLFTTRQSFVDAKTAGQYDLNADDFSDGDFRHVDVQQTERAGLLTHPAVMTSKAHADEPAYVFRGTFVLEKLLCYELPIPPANATASLPDFPVDATQRSKSDLIRGVGTCSGCHSLIDPIGLSFEGFDELGRVRDALPDGAPIDSSGAIVGMEDGLDGGFSSPVELATRLADSPIVERCLARQVFRFAYSRHDDEDADACAIDHLVYGYGTQKQDLRSLLLSLAGLEGFRTRQLVEDEQ